MVGTALHLMLGEAVHVHRAFAHPTMVCRAVSHQSYAALARYPSRAETRSAAVITCGAIVVTARFDIRVSGPAMPTAATTAPVSSRIGAAMQTMPSSLSSFSTAQPRWRTAARALRNLSGTVLVSGRRGTRPGPGTGTIHSR